MAARATRARPRQALVHVLLDRLCTRTAPGRGGVEREVPWPVRPGLGSAAGGNVRAAKAAGRDPARHGADAAPGRSAGMGLAVGGRAEAVRAADGGLRRLPGER